MHITEVNVCKVCESVQRGALSGVTQTDLWLRPTSAGLSIRGNSPRSNLLIPPQFALQSPPPQTKVAMLMFLLLFSTLCWFSNVSSNHLHERMNNHIGCICLTFLLCVFSDVSSNRLAKKRHSHIGCISLIFLHCAFSNVASN